MIHAARSGAFGAVSGAMAALGLVLLACASLAHAESDALIWMRKVQIATQKLSYSGTVLYQQGDRTETSRITRLVDGAGEVEKLEFMDGAPREIVRTKDVARCYLPETRTIKVDRRADRRSFPAVLPQQFEKLSEHYEITLGENRRIAGYDCRELVLKPKDEFRYGYNLWADSQSGMLLKARTFDRQGATVEQFTFTQLKIGNVTREQTKTRHSARNWRVEDASVTPTNLAQSGWSIASALPGFTKIVEVKRRLHEAGAVGQVVYSDGLAAVSVFIEPMEGRREPVKTGLANMGAINIYTRQVANFVVTVVGETPPGSVTRFAETVRYQQAR